ncbi:AbrB family transcriptional regulator [Staphylococcus coagulans]|uniref:AbrB family transcriptional regulator n=1 Tax=Staphylococcus coagulans TaxID=74706 RepID=UPI001BEB94B5|nr:AbrB family transcriptional regulator [Staphylococcus coagulans]MBT2829546.1 AbrB family transcriptional regulator [Staphylococcus coagulans]
MIRKHHINNFIVLGLSIIFGLILLRLHLMLPWMFGPILASLFVIKVLKLEVNWPQWLSEFGLIMLGVQIGTSFTKTVIDDIKNDWFSIILVSVLLLVLSLIVSIGFRKIAKVNRETALLSVIPGALSQMLVMAEENKRTDILVVSLTQTSCIIFVVILVPFISYFFKDANGSQKEMQQMHLLTEVLTFKDILIIGLGICVVYILMKWIHFPTKMLLAPILVLIVWNMVTERTFTLDAPIIAGAQIIYMIRVGIQIAHLTGQLKGRIAVAIAYQNILLIFGTLLMVILIHLFNPASINNLFLSAAPGGMSQIVLVALDTGGDVAMISSYHIFRIFFILFLIAPLISFIFKYQDRKNKRSTS